LIPGDRESGDRADALSEAVPASAGTDESGYRSGNARQTDLAVGVVMSHHEQLGDNHRDDTEGQTLRDTVRSAATRELLKELEELLRQAPSDEARQIVLPVAAAVAPAMGIDLQQAADEAAAYLESFPVPGRAVVDVADMASRWLALRLASDDRRARLRQGLSLLSQAWSAEFPVASQVLTDLVAEPVPDDPGQDDLWVALARAIVVEQLDRL